MKRNAKKRKSARKRWAGKCYTAHGLDTAIGRACDRLWPPPGELARRRGENDKTWLARLTVEQRRELRQWQHDHHWHPNQLRHLHATEVRKRFGLEAAQVVLGHANANTTEIYAEKNEALAAKVAMEMG